MRQHIAGSVFPAETTSLNACLAGRDGEGDVPRAARLHVSALRRQRRRGAHHQVLSVQLQRPDPPLIQVRVTLETRDAAASSMSRGGGAPWHGTGRETSWQRCQERKKCFWFQPYSALVPKGHRKNDQLHLKNVTSGLEQIRVKQHFEERSGKLSLLRFSGRESRSYCTQTLCCHGFDSHRKFTPKVFTLAARRLRCRGGASRRCSSLRHRRSREGRAWAPRASWDLLPASWGSRKLRRGHFDSATGTAQQTWSRSQECCLHVFPSFFK